MGKIVASIGVSHAPGMMSLPDGPPKKQLDNMIEALDKLKKQLDDSKPDLIIAITNDHFENYFHDVMPTFSIGIGEENYGPPKQHVEWLQMERQLVKGNSEYAKEILNESLNSGFDFARSDKLEYGSNLMAPLMYIRPELDIPVVTIMTNNFTRPLASAKRFYEVGKMLKKVIDKRPEKVAILSTGGLSHWPPFWNEERDQDDVFYNRMKKFQKEGLSVLNDDPDLFIDLGLKEEEMAAADILINEEWDRKILKAFEENDTDYLLNLTTEEMVRDGGNGGPEILNWIMLMGIFEGMPSKTLCYEPVREWMEGMGFITYHD